MVCVFMVCTETELHTGISPFISSTDTVKHNSSPGILKMLNTLTDIYRYCS